MIADKQTKPLIAVKYDDDLLDEIAPCELGLKLRSFHRSGRPWTPVSEFKEIFVEFIKRYRVDGFGSEGKHPFDISYSPGGWKIQ